MLQIKNTLGGGKPEGLYVWKKCENNTDHTFIDYVVSDKETAYPDGGEKGEYWYEKVAEGAKVASGSITTTSNSGITIEHGLKKTPTKFMLFKTDVIASERYSCMYSIYKSGDQVYGYYRKSVSLESMSLTLTRVTTLDESKITISESNYNLNGTWNWIVVAE